MKRKTKILAVGDIHGDTGLVKKLVKQAEKEKVDLVILNGDLTFFDSEIKGIIAPFKKINKPVLLVHGNHESEDTIKIFEEIYSNAKNLHGYYYKKGDTGFFGAGGIDWGVEEDTDLFKVLSKGHEKIKDSRKKIMITHMHPSNSKSEFSGWPGSKSITKAIKKFKPDILINSHIHEAGGIEERIGKTRVINVSRRGKIIEI